MVRHGKHIGIAAFVIVSAIVLISLVTTTTGKKNDVTCEDVGVIYASGTGKMCETMFSDDGGIQQACKEAHKDAVEQCKEKCRIVSPGCTPELEEPGSYFVQCGSSRDIKEKEPDGEFGKPMGPAKDETFCAKAVGCICLPPTTPTPTPTEKPTNTPTEKPTSTPTDTPVPPTNTPTDTPVSPTNTPTTAPTSTPVPPTNTPTNTPVPTSAPTATPTSVTPTVTPTT